QSQAKSAIAGCRLDLSSQHNTTGSCTLMNGLMRCCRIDDKHINTLVTQFLLQFGSKAASGCSSITHMPVNFDIEVNITATGIVSNPRTEQIAPCVGTQRNLNTLANNATLFQRKTHKP